MNKFCFLCFYDEWIYFAVVEKELLYNLEENVLNREEFIKQM